MCVYSVDACIGSSDRSGARPSIVAGVLLAFVFAFALPPPLLLVVDRCSVVSRAAIVCGLAESEFCFHDAASLLYSVYTPDDAVMRIFVRLFEFSPSTKENTS